MVSHYDVRNSEQALAYITDCTLATISDMADRKSRSKTEFNRQIAIAQRSVDWMRAFNVDFSKTRAQEVVSEFGASVAAWAQAQIKPT